MISTAGLTDEMEIQGGAELLACLHVEDVANTCYQRPELKKNLHKDKKL